MSQALTNLIEETEFKELPKYVIASKENIPSVLRAVAVPVSFPLTIEDINDIETLEKKFDQEENCAGLAAPQIGISKQIAILSAPDVSSLKKWRPDHTQHMPKTLFINPTWEPIGDAKHKDYEACFSVPGVYGYVWRYKKIHYKAYDINGNVIAGEAEGFLARIMQHEFGHLRGELFIDYVNEGELFSIEEYIEKRKAEMEAGVVKQGEDEL